MKTITAEQARQISNTADVDGFLGKVYAEIGSTAAQGWRSCTAKILWDGDENLSIAIQIVHLLRALGYDATYSTVDEDVETVGSNSVRGTFVLFQIRW
jgi:hypothetical protein